ncbi:Crp/Fnr family transcriptional regulator [Synergistaceae bacterium OttesenSCG-928-I11]|nr:Crp/Fnr family transcriptional regulator [Synergistaceae bacterium OttesenSCG-928-I11]
MKKISDLLPLLERVPLFADIARADLPAMLDCLGAAARAYGKGETVFLAGDAASRIGLVCDGAAQVVREDVFGNRTILTSLGPGELFGETFACARVDHLPVSVVAMSPSEILLLDYRRIVTTCPSSCTFHARLIENMLGILAEKNLMLNRKIEALSARSTRGKLTAYLAAQAERNGSRAFSIPFNRQELADYLAVERSAMSAELGKMRDEGLIRFHRNEFELLKA